MFGELKDALQGAVMGSVLRERLNLALDRAAAIEATAKSQLAAMEARNAATDEKCVQLEAKYLESEDKAIKCRAELVQLHAQLEVVKMDLKQKDEELKIAIAAQAEAVRIHRGIEFRRGSRTGGKWMPFCPVCHGPTVDNQAIILCMSGCKWREIVFLDSVDRMIAEIG